MRTGLALHIRTIALGVSWRNLICSGGRLREMCLLPHRISIAQSSPDSTRRLWSETDDGSQGTGTLGCVALGGLQQWADVQVRLPRLTPLSFSSWQERHVTVLAVLLLLLPVVVGLAVAGGVPLDLTTTYVLVIGLITVLAVSPKVSVPLRQMFGASAVLTATAALVEASGRAWGAHVMFAAALALLTLYRSWTVQAFAVSYLAFYYFVLGSASPDLIFPDGTEQVTAMRDGAILFVASVCASLPGVLAWYLTARSAADAEALRMALSRASLREQQAAELNDTVVQDLVTALYAHEEDDPVAAADSTRRALDSARTIVSSLMSPEIPPEPGVLVRDTPAQDLTGRPSEDAS